jgi:hypothetical protein
MSIHIRFLRQPVHKIRTLTTTTLTTTGRENIHTLDILPLVLQYINSKGLSNASEWLTSLSENIRSISVMY